MTSDSVTISLPWLLDRKDEEWRPLTTATTKSGWVLLTDWRLVENRPEPVSIKISHQDASHALTADAVRRLPLGEVLATGRRQVAEYAAMTLNRIQGGELDAPSGDLADYTRPIGSKRGRRLSADDLSATAEVYRAAWTQGEPVTEAVQRAFTLSRDGASKRIMAARKAGLLEGVGPKR